MSNVNTTISLEQLLEAIANRERIKQEQLHLASIEISKFEELKRDHESVLRQALDLTASNGMEKSLRKLAEVKSEKLEKDNSCLRQAIASNESIVAKSRILLEGEIKKQEDELRIARMRNKAIRAIINSKGRSDRKLKKILTLLP